MKNSNLENANDSLSQRRKMLKTCTLMAVLCAISGLALAQPYPSKPIKLVVAYPPGGVVDIVARTIAGPLSTALKETVLVDNRSGAGGFVGHASVAKSPADGYTLLLSAAGPLISTKMYKSVPYDPVNDFISIAMVGETDVLMVASGTSQIRTLAQLVERAKANPGKVNLSINSIGSIHHLLSELIMIRAGMELNRIPYKGAGQVMPDLLSGVLDVHMESLPLVLQHIKSGRLHPIAVASESRLEALPDTPTFRELGYADMLGSPWYALVAPAGTPKEIVTRLNREMNEVLRQPEIKAQFAKLGVKIITSGADETEKFIRAEIQRVGRILAETGVKAN